MRPAREPDGSAAVRAVRQIRECAVYQRSRHACCAWRPPALRAARKFARVALYWQTLISQIGVNFYQRAFDITICASRLDLRSGGPACLIGAIPARRSGELYGAGSAGSAISAR